MRVAAMCVCRTRSRWAPEVSEQASYRDVVLVLIEFARCEKAMRRNQRFVEFINNGGFTNPGLFDSAPRPSWPRADTWPGTVFNIKHGGVGFLAIWQ